MAEIQAGTRFAAIAPSVDVERRSALVNTTALDYTIEDIAAAVGGDVDLSAYLTIADAEDTYLTITDAEESYQPKAIKYIYPTTIELSTGIAANDILFSGVTIDAGDATCGTFQIDFTGGGSWASTGSYRVAVNTTAIASNFNSVLNISLDFFGQSRGIIPINQAALGSGGFSAILRNVGASTSIATSIAVNWSIIN